LRHFPEFHGIATGRQFSKKSLQSQDACQSLRREEIIFKRKMCIYTQFAKGLDGSKSFT
jgi:hypothetical protein